MRSFVTVGYLHDPRIAVDRIHVQTDGSLDEAPRLRLSGPALSPREWVAAETVDDTRAEEEARRDALRDVIEGAKVLADGEAVDAYISLSGAVDAYLAGGSAEAISAAAWIS